MIATQEGKVFAGRTALDVVIALLKANIFTTAKEPDEFMRAVVRRTLALEGVEVRSDTPENFLADLATAGLITVTQGD